MKYRPEIDGLRAVAVLAVIFYHAGFSFFTGGYVGVDVFFVISGFLITSIIMEDLSKGRFTLAYFYERRARRILPALFVIMAACLPFAWLWMTPDQLKDFSQSMVSVSFFSSNIFFFLKSGYFEQASELKPLLHTWSLAVEEQYYIIFPLVLMLIWQWKTKNIYLTLSIIFVGSMLCAELLKGYNESANFFLLPSRMWELVVGSILAIYLRHNQQPVSFANSLSFIGLALICASIVMFNERTPHPSLVTFLPVFGTALIILAAREGTIVYRLLALKSVVNIGLLSYSAYLWHQPLFAFTRIKWGLDISPEVYLALILATLLLSWVSWKYLESPFRNKAQTSLKQIVLFSCIGSFAFIAIGLVSHFKNGFPERYGAYHAAILEQQEKPGPFLKFCSKNYFSRSKEVIQQRCSLGVEKDQLDFVLWGDSHAAALGYGFDKYLEEHKMSGLQLAANGCPPSPELTREDVATMREACPKNAALALDLIEELKPRYVVISLRWALQFEQERFNNQQGGLESGNDAIVKKIDESSGLTDADLSAYYQAYFSSLAAKLAKQNTRLVIVRQVPEAGWNVPNKTFQMLKMNQPVQVKTLKSVYEDRNKNVNMMLTKLDAADNIVVIDPAKRLCDEEYCYNTYDFVPYYADDDHLSKYGSVFAAEYILSVLTDQ